MSAPALGVAGAWGAAEIDLHRRFDELHQLIYRRGGLRSSNAAVEELAKLLLVRLWADRHGVTLLDHRSAFAAALRDPALAATDPTGARHPIWPVDEPFRLADPQVLAAADELVTGILSADTPLDPLGTAFDALLAGRYDHTGGLGTYLTPSGVARMMARVALPLVTTPASTIAGPGFGDPYCGTGRFLVALLATMPADHPLRVAGAFGADVSAASVAKARINLLLYGVRDPLVWTVSDSVTDSTVDTLAGTVPLILTNPPFGGGQYDSPAGVAAAARVLPGLAGRTRVDPAVACLARAVTLLAPGGVLGIVLPDGVLNSPPVLDLLSGRAPTVPVTLLASVSLPSATFALSGTVARTSAVFLRRTSRKDAPLAPSVMQGRRADSGERGSVVLARVAHVGFVRQAGRAAPDPAGDELPAVADLIVEALTAPPADEPVVPSAFPADDPSARPARSTRSSVNAVPAAGGALVLSHDPLVAVLPRASLRSLDPSTVDPWAAAARHALTAGVPLAEYLIALPARRCRVPCAPYVSVLHVDDLGAIDWHAARSHVPSTPGVLAEPGELIVSLLNPANLRAAVVPPGPAVQVSGEFGVFQSTVDPHAVLALLYSPPVRAQLRPLGRGTSSSRRRITADELLAVTVPKLDDVALAELATTVRAAQQQLSAARERLRATYEQAG